MTCLTSSSLRVLWDRSVDEKHDAKNDVIKGVLGTTANLHLHLSINLYTRVFQKAGAIQQKCMDPIPWVECMDPTGRKTKKKKLKKNTLRCGTAQIK